MIWGSNGTEMEQIKKVDKSSLHTKALWAGRFSTCYVWKESKTERSLNTEKKIEKVLSELTKIQKDYSDKQIANVLETIKKELNCLV